MLILTPTPAQQKKIKGKSLNTKLKPVPLVWEDYMRLTTIRSGGEMKQFNPYKYQLILSWLIDEYPNVEIWKSRQLGITQEGAGKFLHKASLNKAFSSICFMRNQNDSSALSDRVRQMVDCLADYITPANDNVGHLKLKNLGEIRFKNSSKEGGRSYDSVSAYLFDECAFSANIEEIYKASSPSTALAGDNISKIIVSTPGARSGWFWDKINTGNPKEFLDIQNISDAVAEGKIFKNNLPGFFWWVSLDGKTAKVIIHFSAHPIYGQKSNEEFLKYRLEQDGTDWETVQREYNLKFIDSSVGVFSSELIRQNAIGNYEENYDESADYYCGLDTATTGNDYCTFPVFKYKDGKLSLIHLYRKRYQTSEYHLYQIGELIRKYKPKRVGIEVTGGVGQVYLENLIKEFPKVLFESVRTTGDSKPVMISNLLLALEKSQLIYPSNSPLVDEFLSFRRQGNKLEAASGKHDDIVMGSAFTVLISPIVRKEIQSIWVR